MKIKQKAALLYFRLKLKILEKINSGFAAKVAFRLLCTPYTRARGYELPPVFKQGEKLSFTFEQHIIHGIKWTPQNPNGNCILICHGFDSASYKFAHFIKPLLSAGFKVLAFDAPAHGLSTGRTINVLMYRNLILAIIKNFGPVDGIMAHSFGGAAAALALEQLPRNSIKRLALIAPATETTSSIDDFCKALHISRHLRNEIEQLILMIGGQPVGWYSVPRVVLSTTTPTLWIHDREDSITPYSDMAHLPEMNIAHLQFMITTGAGHSVYNDKHVAAAIITFFREMI